MLLGIGICFGYRHMLLVSIYDVDIGIWCGYRHMVWCIGSRCGVSAYGVLYRHMVRAVDIFS